MHQQNLNKIIARLALLSIFCFVAEAARILLTLNINYIFLPWNLILAWVPLWLAVRLKHENRVLPLILYLSLWFIFFPNAPYIMTDFLHLRPRADCPFWFDALLLYSFAFAGLLPGMFSALLVFKKMKELFSETKAKAFMLAAMMLSGYGIYMGRFLRYNSWDLFSDPMQIMADTSCRFLHPGTYPRMYGVTLMAGVLLSLVFFIFESLLVTD